MTEFYHHEQKQQTNIRESSSLLTQTAMPSFYPSTRHRTLITRHLTERDDDDPDSIYKEAFIIQIFQHWKIKTLEHQQALNNATNNQTTNYFSQALANTPTAVEPISQDIPSNDDDNNNNKKDETSVVIEQEEPVTTIQKRVTPVPASYVRRKEALKKSVASSPDLLNPNLLTPYTKTKSRTTQTTKKSPKPGPIFIAPKKTSPSYISRTYSLASFDESNQMKTKPMLEKQNSLNDDQVLTSTSPTWIPTPPITPTRFFSPSFDDDETSSDDNNNNNESLLIRKRKIIKKPTKTIEKSSLPIHPNIIIPTAIFIIDPYGHTRSYDWKNDSEEDDVVNTQRIIDDDIKASNNDRQIRRSTSSSSVDQHGLHSIGEEDEGSIEKDNHNNGNILSKELNRIEAFTRSRQTNLAVENMTNDPDENDKIPLGRRWSDGNLSGDEQPSQSAQLPLTKTSSTASVMKQIPTTTTKISKTKYLLMKLHLTSSSKDDEANISTNPTPPRKRTVRRSSDKKQPDTTQITGEVSVDEPESKPKPKSESIPAVKSRHGSVNTVASTKVTGSQPLTRHVSTTESVASARTDLTRQDSRPDSIGRFSSVIDSDDDIDQTVTKTKLGSKKANSLRDLRGSHLSLTTLMSEAKARFGLQITGTIELKVSYHKNTGSLDIYIKQCLNLAAAKHNKTSDPYCKIYLLPDRSKNSKRKTTVRKGTTSPVFAEILRYHLSEKEFGDRILWISVWSETSLGHNEFLGEINLPLATCQFDGLQEYTLLPRIEPEEETTPPVEQAVQKPEIKFDLIFLPNTNNKEIGIIQVNNIQAKGITYHGKSDIEVVCKGTLMPDKVKKKSPGLGRGPSPKWDLPLRWENIRLKDIKNTSMQISIWTLERFRKSMIGFVNLNTTRGHSDDKNVKMLNSEEREKIVWEKFLKDPTKNNEIRLPLRLSPNAKT